MLESTEEEAHFVDVEEEQLEIEGQQSILEHSEGQLTLEQEEMLGHEMLMLHELGALQEVTDEHGSQQPFLSLSPTARFQLS